jgi:hypothetical protein
VNRSQHFDRTFNIMRRDTWQRAWCEFVPFLAFPVATLGGRSGVMWSGWGAGLCSRRWLVDLRATPIVAHAAAE